MTSLITSSPHLPAAPGPFASSPASDRSPAKELIGIILQRLWPAAGVGAAVALLIVGVLLQMPKTYTATGSLLIQPKRENLATPNNDSPQLFPPDTSAIDTQVEVLKSPAVAAAVTQRLKLYDDPEFNPGLHGRPAPAGFQPTAQNLSQVAAIVQSHTRVRRVGLTYVVDVGFASRSPAKAQLIANDYMDIYLERQLDQKIAEVTKANAELGSQVERLRASAEQAEEQVQQYKVANNLYSAEGSTIAEQAVTNLDQQVASAKADAAEKEARLRAAMEQVARGSGGADIGAAVSSETVKELRKDEATTAEKLADLQQTFKPDYPEVKRTQAQLNAIRSDIQSELNRIMSSVKAEATAASQREASLMASVGQAEGSLKANNRALVGLVALQQRADSAKQIYDAFLNRAKEVAAETSLQQPDATVTSNAPRPLKPSSPNLKVGAALALLLGMLSSAATILLMELWDHRLRSRTDVEARLGVPFAGVLPESEKRALLANPVPSGRVAQALLDQPFSSFAESFRNLRAFLNFADPSPNARLLGVTSSLPREGKSVTCLCLARTLALSGSKVVLVDCDLRRRGLSKTAADTHVGLIEVVQGKATLEQALVRDLTTGVWILPASNSAPLPYDLFSGPQVDKLFQELARHFEHVILDLPPVLGVADARILAAKADRVLYLVHWNKTPSRTAQSGLDILQESGANVVGAVLTRVNINQQARYGYCDSSDYFKHYRQYYLSPSA